MTLFYQHDRAISAAEEAALTQYTENGGILLVTGQHSLGTPVDSRLANVCHVATEGDYSGHTECRVVDEAYPALDGL